MATFSKPARLPELLRTQQRPLVLAALVLVLLRSRLASLSKDGVTALASKFKGKQAKEKLSPEENLRVLQKLYEEDPKNKDVDVLLVPYRDRITKVRTLKVESPPGLTTLPGSHTGHLARKARCRQGPLPPAAALGAEQA